MITVNIEDTTQECGIKRIFNPMKKAGASTVDCRISMNPNRKEPISVLAQWTGRGWVG